METNTEYNFDYTPHKRKPSKKGRRKVNPLPEAERVIPVAFTANPPMIEMIDKLADERGWTRSRMVRHIVVEWMKQSEGQEPVND